MFCVTGTYVLLLFFFFFKRKTAYEMRISDWSSDVCSSDLIAGPLVQLPRCRVGFSLGDVGQAGSWEVLPPQIHCVLAGSALPRMVWVAEIDGGQCKAPVCRNFLPPVSSQRLIQLFRQAACILDQGVDHRVILFLYFICNTRAARCSLRVCYIDQLNPGSEADMR